MVIPGRPEYPPPPAGPHLPVPPVPPGFPPGVTIPGRPPVEYPYPQPSREPPSKNLEVIYYLSCIGQVNVFYLCCFGH